MKKQLLLSFLFVFLTMPSAYTTPAAADTGTMNTVIGYLTDNPITNGIAWVVEKTLLNDTLAHTIAQNNDLDKNIEHTKIELQKTLADYKNHCRELGTTLGNLNKDYNVSISHSQWEKYLKPIVQEETKRQPLNITEIQKHLDAARNQINNEFHTDVDACLASLKKVHTAQKNDFLEAKKTWLSHQGTYNTLQEQLIAGTSPSYLKTAFRWLGYSTVFLGGPYVGHRLYNKFLQPYFTPSVIDTDALLRKIDVLVRKKSAAKNDEEKRLLQEEIDQLNDQLAQPQQKPSAWLKYAGIGVHVGTMALTTYLSYWLFKKFDKNYLTSTTLSEAEQSAITNKIQQLTPFKEQFEEAEVTHRQLEKMMQTLSIGKDQTLAYLLARVKGGVEGIGYYEKSIAESSERLDEIKAHAIGGILNPISSV